MKIGLMGIWAYNVILVSAERNNPQTKGQRILVVISLASEERGHLPFQRPLGLEVAFVVGKPKKEEIHWTHIGLESVFKVPLLHQTSEAMNKIFLENL